MLQVHRQFIEFRYTASRTGSGKRRRDETLYGVARKSADILRMSLVTSAAMLAISLLALVETKNTAGADSPPQNGKIAFTTRDQSGVGYDIYTVNPDGSNLSRLINNNETDYLPQPAWSPDGTKIAFPYGDPKVGVGPNDSIGVMDTNGSNLRVLTPNLWYVSHSNLAWSPDGKKLAFKGKINELGESLF